MKKAVIAGSAKSRDKIDEWISNFKSRGYEVLDYPKHIDEKLFMDLYPDIHKNFFENIIKTDVLFIMNEDKNGIEGYIGPETFAELAFGVAQNLIYDKKIDLIVYKMPNIEVSCYEEIKRWLELGWIKLYDELDN